MPLGQSPTKLGQILQIPSPSAYCPSGHASGVIELGQVFPIGQLSQLEVV